MEEGAVMKEESNGGTGELQAKMLCSIPASMETSSDQQGHDLNFPIPSEKGLPCLVKVGSCSCFLLIQHYYTAVQRF